ncbi:MAG TPA: hypothetical protein VGI16_06445 [Candidatus Acidoferrum sp.]|jgi:hypothetical protein
MIKQRKSTKSKKKPKRKLSRHKALNQATADYFASLSPSELKAENRLGAAMAYAASQINFDADE